MRNTYATFDLPAWRRRLGWNQERAARELGLSIAAYRVAEYRCADHPQRPCILGLVHLAQLLERHPPALQWQPPPLVDDIGKQQIHAAGRTKLTAAKVRAIRKSPKSVTNAELARKFGVSAPAVAAARAGETWKHVQ